MVSLTHNAMHQPAHVHIVNLRSWSGGDIAYHLGLTGPRDLPIWAPFRVRLASEPFLDVVHDSETIAAFGARLNHRAESA